MVIALSPSPKVTLSPSSSTATLLPVIALSAAPAARSSGDLPQAARPAISDTETANTTTLRITDSWWKSGPCLGRQEPRRSRGPQAATGHQRRGDNSSCTRVPASPGTNQASTARTSFSHAWASPPGGAVTGADCQPLARIPDAIAAATAPTSPGASIVSVVPAPLRSTRAKAYPPGKGTSAGKS